MRYDVELVKSQAAQADELVKLNAALADIDEKLKRISADPSLAAGQRVINRRIYERERQKAVLRINLFHEKQTIERCKREYEVAQSPLGLAVAEGNRCAAKKRQMKLAAGRALGGGSSTPYGLAQTSFNPVRDPLVLAKQALDAALASHARTSRELEGLCNSDRQWDGLLADAEARERQKADSTKPSLRTTGDSRNQGPVARNKTHKRKKARLPTTNFTSPIKTALKSLLANELPTKRLTMESICQLLDIMVKEGKLRFSECFNGEFESFEDFRLLGNRKQKQPLFNTIYKVRTALKARGQVQAD